MKWTEEVNGVYVPIQYDLRGDPWRMLVACMLMNRAGGHQAKEALERMETVKLNDMRILEAPLLGIHRDLVWACEPCGFQNQRAKRIIMFTLDWHTACNESGEDEEHGLLPTTVYGLHGVGQYALDSYKMFVMGEYVDAPADHVLSAFVHSELFAQFARTGRIDADT